jgi:hypothetical protein
MGRAVSGVGFTVALLMWGVGVFGFTATELVESSYPLYEHCLIVALLTVAVLFTGFAAFGPDDD